MTELCEENVRVCFLLNLVINRTSINFAIVSWELIILTSNKLLLKVHNWMLPRKFTRLWYSMFRYLRKIHEKSDKNGRMQRPRVNNSRCWTPSTTWTHTLLLTSNRPSIRSNTPNVVPLLFIRNHGNVGVYWGHAKTAGVTKKMILCAVCVK